MIAIDDATFWMAMRALRDSYHAEARLAEDRMRLAAMKSATREIEFNNEVPALLRAQA